MADGRPLDGMLIRDDPCPADIEPLYFALPLPLPLMPDFKNNEEYAPDPLNAANGLLSDSLLARAPPAEHIAPFDRKFAL